MFILLPQIVRNVRFGNGGDGEFDYWYVIGFLSTRNFIVLYENICPQNYLRIKPYLWETILLITLLVLQVNYFKNNRLLFYIAKVNSVQDFSSQNFYDPVTTNILKK
jgi:hypothetical protein